MRRTLLTPLVLVLVGTAFQRFDAYRAGFLEGMAACDALLDEG